MELSAEQVMTIGFVAMVVVQGIKLFAAWRGQAVGRKPVTVLLFVLAVALGYGWARQAMPAFPAPVDDPMMYAGLVAQWLGQLVAEASAVIGFGVLIYNLLAQKVFDALNLGREKLLELRGGGG